jgi:MEDS: MEthanogen/methylotroph, DcmR Sensory domain
MGAVVSSATGNAAPAKLCQLVVRHQEGPSEFLRFMLEGLEVGQQVVALAGAGCLRTLARALSDTGIQPQSLLRSSRLVFFTAPDCLVHLKRLHPFMPRPILRRQGPIVRWVSDWSWAYSDGRVAKVLLDYQHRVHEVVRSLDGLSLCTVQSSALERRALLAVLADHRQAVRGRATPARQPFTSHPSQTSLPH